MDGYNTIMRRCQQPSLALTDLFVFGTVATAHRDRQPDSRVNCFPSRMLPFDNLTMQQAPRALGPRLLTLEEVAGMLRVSKSTLYRLVERREIRFYRLPGSLRFAEEDVRAYLRNNCVERMNTKI